MAITGDFYLSWFQEVLVEDSLLLEGVLYFPDGCVVDFLEFAFFAVSDYVEFVCDLAVSVHVEAIEDDALDSTIASFSIHDEDHSSFPVFLNISFDVAFHVEIVIKVERKRVLSAFLRVNKDIVEKIDQAEDELGNKIREVAIDISFANNHGRQDKWQKSNRGVLNAIGFGDTDIFGLIYVTHGKDGDDAEIISEAETPQNIMPECVGGKSLDVALLCQKFHDSDQEHVALDQEIDKGEQSWTHR